MRTLRDLLVLPVLFAIGYFGMALLQGCSHPFERPGTPVIMPAPHAAIAPDDSVKAEPSTAVRKPPEARR